MYILILAQANQLVSLVHVPRTIGLAGHSPLVCVCSARLYSTARVVIAEHYRSSACSKRRVLRHIVVYRKPPLLRAYS